MNLSSKHCVPCETKIPPFTREQAEEYLKQTPGWTLRSAFAKGSADKQDEKRSEYLFIERKWKFNDFTESMAFVNKVAELAEHEGHHPDIMVHYNEVALTLWTHFIGGLFENDFIVAARINELK